MSDVPGGRGLWRLTVHRRTFTPTAWPADTGITELTDARSRRLEQAANAPAKLTFTVDGRSPAAAFVQELTTEVIAWRWDHALGRDVQMFRGVVAQSEDIVTEQAHTVNFTCHDWLAVLVRRFLTAGAALVYTQTDQDDIVANLLGRASSMTAGNGTAFAPGSTLPVAVRLMNPDGTVRAAKSGQLRDRSYAGQQSIGDAITDLAAVINGFDVDVQPLSDQDGRDYLRIWYPSQGIGRPAAALVYGTSVSAFTRAVNSADYGNYVRVIGDNGGTEGAPQLFAETWNADANDVGRIPVGLWMTGDNASDVNQQATLNQKAAGDLNDSGVLVPSYTLTMRPGWYRPGFPGMGDTVPLTLRTGRLNVDTTVRVVGISYAISDDGAGEDVDVTVGRPALALTGLFRAARRDIDALARR